MNRTDGHGRGVDSSPFVCIIIIIIIIITFFRKGRDFGSMAP